MKKILQYISLRTLTLGGIVLLLALTLIASLVEGVSPMGVYEHLGYGHWVSITAMVIAGIPFALAVGTILVGLILKLRK